MQTWLPAAGKQTDRPLIGHTPMTSTAGKDTDSGVPKERLPKGQKFMPRVCLKRLARTWKDEPAGKSKQVAEACRRRKEGQGIHSMAREMGMNYSTVQGGWPACIPETWIGALIARAPAGGGWFRQQF